jgi:hypothetical protein
VEQKIADILRTHPQLASSKPLRPLGLELVGRGLITADQLRITNQQVLMSGRDAGEVLVENEFVVESQVVSARAAIWGCPAYNPPANIKPCEVQIPRLLRTRSQMLPVHYVPGTKQLLLGFLRFVDYELMSAVEQMTGCVAKACFIKPSDFCLHANQEESETLDVTKEVIIQDAQRPNEFASILCSRGAAINANEVQITFCKNYLWTRLSSEKGICDILFIVD